MKLSIPIIMAAMVTVTHGYMMGFYITTSDPYASDNCRNQSSWENAFQSIKSLPSKQFDHVLIRRSASCNLLSNVVPAAVNNNISVLVELNAENEMKSRIDQIELQDALVFYGNSWLAAVSFSYQPEHTSAKLMLERIEDVENMLARLGMGSPVGHIINARDLDDHLIDPQYEATFAASDFIGIVSKPIIDDEDDDLPDDVEALFNYVWVTVSDDDFESFAEQSLGIMTEDNVEALAGQFRKAIGDAKAAFMKDIEMSVEASVIHVLDRLDLTIEDGAAEALPNTTRSPSQVSSVTPKASKMF